MKKAKSLTVRSGLKAGRLASNHAVKVRSGLKSGRLATNHAVKVRSGVKAGGVGTSPSRPGDNLNHALRLRTA
jgi:hypothetical protein